MWHLASACVSSVLCTFEDGWRAVRALPDAVALPSQRYR